MILCFAILFTVKCKYFKGYFDSKYDKRISHLLCVCDLKFNSKSDSSELLDTLSDIPQRGSYSTDDSRLRRLG